MPVTGNNTVKADETLIDETFDVSQAESYHLSIQTEPGRLSFCVRNTVINKYVVLRHYTLPSKIHDMLHTCNSIFEDDNLLGLKYKSSCHVWISPRCTLLPEHLFDPNEITLYLDFNHGTVVGEQAFQNHIRSAALHNVFSCPEALVTLLRRYQPDIQLMHHATPFIESIIAATPSSSRRSIAVYFYSHHLDVMVTEHKRLLFYNTFPIGAPEDAVYYLVGTANSFHIDLSAIRLVCMGNFTHRIPLELAILKKYVGRISECEPIGTVTYSHCITEPIRKKFIHLFNLYGCES